MTAKRVIDQLSWKYENSNLTEEKDWSKLVRNSLKVHPLLWLKLRVTAPFALTSSYLS